MSEKTSDSIPGTYRWEVTFKNLNHNSEWTAVFSEITKNKLKPLDIGNIHIKPNEPVVISSEQKFDAHWQAYRSTVDFVDLPNRNGSPAASDPNDIFWKGLTINSQVSQERTTYFVKFQFARPGTGYLQLKYPPTLFQLRPEMLVAGNDDGNDEILMIPTKQMIMRITIDVR